MRATSLAFSSCFGRFDALLADAHELLGEFHRLLSDEHFVEEPSHVGQHAKTLRLPGPFGLLDLLADHVPG